MVWFSGLQDISWSRLIISVLNNGDRVISNLNCTTALLNFLFRVSHMAINFRFSVNTIDLHFIVDAKYTQRYTANSRRSGKWTKEQGPKHINVPKLNEHVVFAFHLIQDEGYEVELKGRIKECPVLFNVIS